jgi:predicted dehydrogenase
MTYQRAYERRLRIGVVGVGSHAYRNILPALHYLPVSLTALCDLNGELLARTVAEYPGAAPYTDAERMYAEMNLDAVLLVAGPRQHPTLAAQALQAGGHVWMEKPPAIRAADVQEIIAARGDRVGAVGFKKAYMPATRKAKELLSRPEFGPLRSLLAVYPMTMPMDGAGVLERGGSPNWLNNGCHPLSLLVELASPVRAVTTIRGPGFPVGRKGTLEAAGVVYLHFASGAVGTFHLAPARLSGYPIERYELFGDEHVIGIENSSRVAYHRGIPFDYATTHDFTGPGLDTGSVVWEVEHRLATLENKALFIQGVFDELFDFCLAILDRRPLRTTDLEFALHIMRIYEAALLSDGHPIEIAE